MKAASIIGIIVFSICLIGMCAPFTDYDFLIFYRNLTQSLEPCQDKNMQDSIAWGFFGMLYAIPFSIVCLVKSFKSKSTGSNVNYADLLKLSELKEKGILTEEEFKMKKSRLI